MKINIKIIIGIGVFVVIIFFVSFFTALLKPSPSPTSQQQIEQQDKTPTTTSISPLQKTIIGQTTSDQIKSNFSIIEEKQLPDGSTAYSIPSPLTSRPIEIRTKEDVVVFERELTPVDSIDPGYSTITFFQNEYGEPDEVFKGSLYYGSYLEHLIYSSRGFTLIANPNTDEVFEIHFFEPMSVEEYVKMYGDDIDLEPKPPSESHG